MLHVTWIACLLLDNTLRGLKMMLDLSICYGLDAKGLNANDILGGSLPLSFIVCISGS